jgi:acyl-CoA reductase-like NAD-dependent aldehyde dehydrogenase
VGRWGLAGRTIPILSPVTGEEISRIVAGNAVDAARAVDAAHEVFRTWGRTSPYERQAAASSPPTSRGKGMVINLEDGLIGLFG